MLSKFSVKNFKALEDVTVESGVVTVLIGPNGSGKSSLIQGLGVLKQSIGQGGLNLQNPPFNLGTFQEVVTRGEISRQIHFRLSLVVDEDLEPYVTRGNVFEYVAEFDQGGVLSQRGTMNLKGGPVSGGWSRYGGKTGEVGIDLDNVSVRIQGGGSSVGQPFETTSFGTKGELSAAERDRIERGWRYILNIWQDFLYAAYFVPPLRGVVRPHFPLTDSGKVDLSPYAPDPVSLATEAVSSLAYDRELEARVSPLISRVLERHVRARLVPQRNVSLEIQAPTLRLNAMNEGFGVNQLIFPLLQVAAAPQGSLVAIEEPEIHLHPLAQTLLCEVLAEAAQQERKQLILTTHSEHILIGFLNLVAQTILKPDQLAVYYFEAKNGIAKPSRLPVDDKGRIEGGLKGFFEADLAQLTQFFEALKSKGSE